MFVYWFVRVGLVVEVLVGTRVGLFVFVCVRLFAC